MQMTSSGYSETTADEHVIKALKVETSSLSVQPHPLILERGIKIPALTASKTSKKANRDFISRE